MKIAYFDCFSGAAGDMIIGALLDAGSDFEYLKAQLAKLNLPQVTVRTEKVVRAGLSATKFHVDVPHEHAHRGLRDIETIISSSSLEADIIEKSIQVFRKLAEAEARVHSTSVDQIHFHEVGALDCIIDIVGTIIALENLGIERIEASRLNVGSGFVKCAHGILPVPAPAVIELTKGLPVYSSGVEKELLTPTGAALLSTLSFRFGSLPNMKIAAVGHGAGNSDTQVPNVTRVFVGEVEENGHVSDEEIAVIETNIDDMNPQIYDYLLDKLLQEGALDFFLQPIQMKKNRPGLLLTVLCPLNKVGQLSETIMRETTTIGIRWRTENRLKAQRHLEYLETEFGRLQIKVATLANTVVNVTPEYDDCKRIARETGLPLKRVLEKARIAIETQRITD